MSRNILLVDDDIDVTNSLCRALKSNNLEAKIDIANSSDVAIRTIKSASPNVVVMDLCLDERNGVESGFVLIRSILEIDPTCRIIVLTGHGSTDHGVRALQMGAASFLEKPADISHLIALINDGIRQSGIRREYVRLTDQNGDFLSINIVGKSQLAKELINSIYFASQTNQPVFITGETGTGKGLCALAIHKAGKRSANKFVRYQPNYSTTDLVNSELFGHTKGAFTGAIEERRGLIAEADGGTLFLDEIDEIPIETQVSLLGVLQERLFRPLGTNKELSSDFRLITASNFDLNEALSTGKIRKDFFHRISHIRVHVPALRERRGDIVLLAEHFLKQLCEKEQVQVFGLSEAATAKLERYSWPGNIRELEAVVEGAAYRAQFEKRALVLPEHFFLGSETSNQVTSADFYSSVRNFEIGLVRDALEKTDGNQVKAAELLGINRTTLRRIAKELPAPFLRFFGSATQR